MLLLFSTSLIFGFGHAAEHARQQTQLMKQTHTILFRFLCLKVALEALLQRRMPNSIDGGRN
jgi:hypothetical protein